MNTAINWAYKHEMYQQAITLIREAVVTFLILENNKPEEDILTKTSRLEYEEAINEVSKREEDISEFPYIEKYTEIVKLWGEVSQLRNDMNHAGFNKNAAKFNKLQNRIKELINRFIEMTTSTS